MIKKTIENPKTVVLLTELMRRSWMNFDPLKLAHEKQRDFIVDNSLYVAAVCSRRAGKTYGAVLKMIDTAKRYPGSVTLYIGLTRDDAKKIVLPYFKRIKFDYKLPIVINEHRNQIKFANGSIIDIASSDIEGLSERFRGKNFPLVCIDEAQSYRADLNYLINEVLTYCVAEWRHKGAGQIILLGTPHPTTSGYFYDVTENKKHNYSIHAWSMFDNPYFPEPQNFLEELLTKFNLSIDDPKIQREVFGRWIVSQDELVYKIPPDAVVERLPDIINTVTDWVTVLGFDLAFHPDKTAYVIARYSKKAGKIMVVYAKAFEKQIVEDVASTIKELQRRYNVTIITGDLGALGRMIGEELTRRYGIPIKAAEKKAKSYFISQLNSDLALGRVLFLADPTKELRDQALKLAWRNGEEDKNASNDILDAFLYAWRYCYHYLTEKNDGEEIDPFEKMLLERYSAKQREA